MHEITLHSQRKSIRFRRWSRKNYAVFGSLHRHVTIGRVCKGIADSSLDKARHIVSVEGNGQRVYAMDGVREQDALAQDIGIPLGCVMLRLMGHLWLLNQQVVRLLVVERVRIIVIYRNGMAKGFVWHLVIGAYGYFRHSAFLCIQK